MNTMVYASGSFVSGATSGTIAMAIVVATFALIAVTANCFIAKQTGIAVSYLKEVWFTFQWSYYRRYYGCNKCPRNSNIHRNCIAVFSINLIGNTIYERMH